MLVVGRSICGRFSISIPLKPVVVACGNEARDACRETGIAAIEICHPGMQALNRYPGNREKHVEGLREAARLVAARESP
jgi:hypothetical protein